MTEDEKFEDAYTAVTNEDYDYALELFTELAKKDHTESQFNLGMMYYYGLGVDQDYKKAKKWLSKSDDVDAQNNLGIMYLEGQGVDQDYNKAFELFQKSGNECNLGFMYQNGYGVDEDINAAKVWYEASSEKNNQIGIFNLGVIYHLEKDYVNAFKWYQKAAEMGHSDAQYYLGNMYRDGHGVNQNNTEAYLWYVISGLDKADKAKENISKKMITERIDEAEIKANNKINLDERIFKWKNCYYE